MICEQQHLMGLEDQSMVAACQPDGVFLRLRGSKTTHEDC